MYTLAYICMPARNNIYSLISLLISYINFKVGKVLLGMQK